MKTFIIWLLSIILLSPIPALGWEKNSPERTEEQIAIDRLERRQRNTEWEIERERRRGQQEQMRRDSDAFYDQLLRDQPQRRDGY